MYAYSSMGDFRSNAVTCVSDRKCNDFVFVLTSCFFQTQFVCMDDVIVTKFTKCSYLFWHAHEIMILIALS